MPNIRPLLPIPVLMTLVYLIFQNHHPSNDAWAYAADAVLGVDLLSPHHLLYTLTAHGVLGIFDFEFPIHLLQAMNALFAGISLVLLGLLLHRSNISVAGVCALQFLAGVSFVVMRFATENEAYMVPMPFVLLGCIVVQSKNSDFAWMLSGLCFGIAILYHQQHLAGAGMLVLWGVFFSRNFRGIVVFILCMLIPVAVGYFIAGEYVSGSGLKGWQYFFHDFYKGSAQFVPGVKQWLLTPVSLIRSVFQVHGYMFPIWSGNVILGMMSALGMSIVLYAIYRLRGTFSGYQKTKATKLPLFLLCGYFVFSVWFGANQEFMVPLPFFGLWFLALAFPGFSIQWVVLLGSGIFLWNLVNGLIPQRYLRLHAEAEIADMVVADTRVVWILNDESRMRHRLRYRLGIDDARLLHSPSYYLQMYGDFTKLEAEVDSFLGLGFCIRTDVLGAPDLISRGRILELESGRFWDTGWEVVDSVITDVGTYKVYEKCPRQQGVHLILSKK